MNSCSEFMLLHFCGLLYGKKNDRKIFLRVHSNVFTRKCHGNVYFFLKRCELGSMLYLALGKMEDKYGQVLKRQWISAV